MAAAVEINVDAAIVAVLSELDGIFPLEEEPKIAVKGFLDGQDRLALLCTGIGKN